MRLRAFTYFLVLLLGATAVTASGQKTDLRFTHLTINDGLSQSAVNCITQDRQGFIWIGTQDGLNLYDGYSFRVFKSNPEDSSSISNNYVWDILEDVDGNLWLATEDGLNRFDKATRKFTAYFPDEKGGTSATWSLAEDEAGNIWIGTQTGGLFRLDKESNEFTMYVADGQPGSLPNNSIRDLFVDSQKRLWIGTQGGGLAYYNPAEDNFTTLMHDPGNPISISNDIIWSIAEDNNGKIWVGTNDGINTLTQVGDTYIAQRYYHDPENQFSLGNNIVVKVFRDSNGFLWAGTRGGGLNKIILHGEESAPTFIRYSHNDFLPYSLANDLVEEIFEDRSGSIWVGTLTGISRFDPAKQGYTHVTALVNNRNSLQDKNIWCFGEDSSGNLYVGNRAGMSRINMSDNTYRHFSRKTNNLNRLNDNSVLSVYIDEEDVIWVGMVDGVFRLIVGEDEGSDTWEQVIYRDRLTSLSDNRVYTIVEDHEGFLWFGTREGVSRYNPRSGEFWFCQHDPSDPLSLGGDKIRAIHEDQNGNMWIGTDGGGLNKVRFEEQNGETVLYFERYPADPDDPEALSSNEIMSICGGPDGEMWIGTYGGGINRFDPETGKAKRYNESDGLSNNVVYGILADDDGRLWLSTNFGLNRFDIQSGTFKSYFENDGLQSNEFNIGAFYRDPNGRFFFGGINGFNAFYPEEIRDNEKPPQMVLTDIKLFNKSMEVGGESPLQRHISLTPEITLNYRQNNLTIDFAALHYSNPGENRYQYILEGDDEDWNHVGNRQTAYYTNLSYGDYTFRVKGTNSDGVWSEEEAVLKITITPPFWHTWWFRFLVFVAAIGLIIYIVRRRVNLIKAQKRRLEVLVAKRTKEVERQKTKIEDQKTALEEEKEKAESLLLNILPAETVEELKAKGKATARSYRRATVMFTDFKGFTSIAEQFTPTELVSELDSHFVVYDEIIEKHGVEKIKTMGDAYMAAGGVPIRNKSNPIDTVLAGLKIQQYMQRLKVARAQDGKESWELRIGIHTGEIIAGVIGTKRFAYDIWGDTVNVANRMETSGEAGKVNVSGETYNFIEPLFECTYRGKVGAKNKGEIDMYFVDRIRPALCDDEEGVEPNQRFWEYVNLLLYSNINYKNAERKILHLLETELPENLHYHGIHHTHDVTKAVEMYGLREGITNEGLYLLKSAALCHDAGFTREYSNNEPIGVEISKEVLPEYGYTDEQMVVISGLILATAIPHKPNNHLEEIMCDADLDYLGRDDFHPISESLKDELKERGFVKTDRHWDEIQVKFFTMHKYFTKTAIALRQEKKMIHFEQIKARLEMGGYPDGS